MNTDKIKDIEQTKEQIKNEIKEIIYGCAKKGGMCEDLEDGQIIGFWTTLPFLSQ